MNYCQFEIIGRTNNGYDCICLRCLKKAELPVTDVNRVKRRCVTRVINGLVRYACWDQDGESWRYRWHTPKDAPENCEQCEEDISLVGTRLAQLFEKFGDWKDLECGCRELEGQINAANLDFVRKHTTKIAKLIQASAKRGGVSVKLTPLKAAIKIALVQEKLKLSKRFSR